MGGVEMQKRFNEFFAKIILENCFPNKFQNIEVSDKPDLRYNGNKMRRDSERRKFTYVRVLLPES